MDSLKRGDIDTATWNLVVPKKTAPKSRKWGSWKVVVGYRVRHGLNKQQADRLVARYNRFTHGDEAYATQ